MDIANASYGFPGTIVEDYTAEALRTVSRFGPPLQVVAQKGVRNPTIFVWLAGNSHGDECDEGAPHCVADSNSSTGFSFNATSPSPEGGAVAKLPELRGHNVVVVAVDTDDTIAEFSNRCGIAGPWCIAAPGTGITGAYFGPLVPPPGTILFRTDLTGTSFAAPMVSGGLALMKHFFRSQLSNRALLVRRLFATADKSGIYASDRRDGTSSDLRPGVDGPRRGGIAGGARTGDGGQPGRYRRARHPNLPPQAWPGPSATVWRARWPAARSPRSTSWEPRSGSTFRAWSAPRTGHPPWRDCRASSPRQRTRTARRRTARGSRLPPAPAALDAGAGGSASTSRR